jgi:hypothetical protein
MRGEFVYLMAVMGWYSRYVLSWEVSASLETSFFTAALDWALQQSQAEIFNTDQGAQFTSEVFTRRLENSGVRISMDGRARAMDNIFIERLWRTVKYEDIFLHDYADVEDVLAGLKRYFRFYNHDRPHQSLGNQTPAAVYFLLPAVSDSRRTVKAGHAGSRPNVGTSPINDPGATFPKKSPRSALRKRLVTTVCVSRRIGSTISIRGHNVLCQSPV